jgi:hypothetical protein
MPRDLRYGKAKTDTEHVRGRRSARRSGRTAEFDVLAQLQAPEFEGGQNKKDESASFSTTGARSPKGVVVGEERPQRGKEKDYARWRKSIEAPCPATTLPK